MNTPLVSVYGKKRWSCKNHYNPDEPMSTKTGNYIQWHVTNMCPNCGDNLAEQELQNKIISRLKKEGHLVMRVNGGRRGNISCFRWTSQGKKWNTKGLSDVTSISPKGRFCAWEIKDGEDKKASPEQLEFLVEVNNAGGFGVLVGSMEAFELLFRRLSSVIENGK